MRISAVEEYGLRCLLALARKGPDEQMTIPEIAREEGLSMSYTSKILWTLRRAGLVKAERGRSGGFSIKRSPEKINLYEILTALGGPLVDQKHCSKYTGKLDRCVHTGRCSIHDVLGGLSGFIRSFLSATTLKDIMIPPGRKKLKDAMADVAVLLEASGQRSGSVPARTN